MEGEEKEAEWQETESEEIKLWLHPQSISAERDKPRVGTERGTTTQGWEWNSHPGEDPADRKRDLRDQGSRTEWPEGVLDNE